MSDLATRTSVRRAKSGNNSGLLSDNERLKPLLLLNIAQSGRMVPGMSHILRISGLLLALTLMPAAAQAACYADYKAKRDRPLQLHYGVMQVSSCSPAEARQEVAGRLASAGWTLLNVLSTFDESGLERRKADAGQYYLRF